MSILTLAPNPTGTPDPAYYAGRADAYDDHAEGTPISVLIVRLSYLIDHHPDLAYVTGYAQRLREIDREEHAHRAAITHHDPYWSTAVQPAEAGSQP